MPGMRIVNDAFSENSKESLNESYDFKLENSLGNKENENEYRSNTVSNFKKLNSLELNKDKRLKDKKLSNFTASYLNEPSLFDASSFKSAISYDLVESFPALNNFEKESFVLFSRPIIEEESKLKESSASSLAGINEVYEKVTLFLMINY